MNVQNAEETLALYYERSNTKILGMDKHPLCARTQRLAMGPDSYLASIRLRTHHTTTHKSVFNSRSLLVLACRPLTVKFSLSFLAMFHPSLPLLKCSSSPLVDQFALLSSSPLTVPSYAQTDITQQNSSAKQQHIGIGILKQLERTSHG